MAKAKNGKTEAESEKGPKEKGEENVGAGKTGILQEIVLWQSIRKRIHGTSSDDVENHPGGGNENFSTASTGWGNERKQEFVPMTSVIGDEKMETDLSDTSSALGSRSGERGARLKKHRIATCNMSTLDGKLDKLLLWMKTEEIDTAMLQEVRIGPNALKAKERLVKSFGYKLLANAEEGDNPREGGLAIITRGTVDTLALPDSISDRRRVQVCRIHRAELPVLKVANVHLHNNARKARLLLEEATEYLATIGGPRGVIGDFNLVPSEAGVAQYLVRGTLRLGDTDLEMQEPTRKEKRIGHNPRHVDYLLHTSDVGVSGRKCTWNKNGRTTIRSATTSNVGRKSGLRTCGRTPQSWKREWNTVRRNGTRQ